MRIHYNSKAVLTFSLLCTAMFIGDSLTAGAFNAIFGLDPFFNPYNPLDYVKLFSCVFAHANTEHILGNLSFILLLGPVLEEKYGTGGLSVMIALTALVTSVLNLVFFDTGLIGASGIVFMFIILTSFGSFEKGKIPLTFILIFVLFVGKEVMASIENDNISQFAHIIGGLCGSVFGFNKNFFNK